MEADVSDPESRRRDLGPDKLVSTRREGSFFTQPISLDDVHVWLGQVEKLGRLSLEIYACYMIRNLSSIQMVILFTLLCICICSALFMPALI